MKKSISAAGMTVLFLFLLQIPLNGQTVTTTSIEPTPVKVTKEEFPLWVKDLRRAEIVAFGSFPFTIFFAITAVDTYRWATHDWDNRYAPWPVKSSGAVSMTNNELFLSLGIGIAGAVAISVADHIIIRVKRSRAEREIQALPPGDPIIIRTPSRQDIDEDHPDGADGGLPGISGEPDAGTVPGV
ncbi:hypothetical protein [Breznakiella homolactica]|uniref:Uncharacterized protein n=1 Tax=Breznakiella homolactica TaxID=2798577 RepID=A0A7T7XKP7_9SPIR|nr:hypothetical protein [Breznakiella homolactica]QQO08037.1 hypothetical protein JFL75_13940 [Breznakiella homolactica]